ncbi:glycosyltransferase [Thalassomonas actiniarum]|uniref:Glycosyltransferase n=1 Tax=Thalassomonas actiniarum TaxID=485447 RepID=A0AAF0C1L3_9GAMM|nr:glycosyltransferase [Thalassomonas actiniarum]WDD96834.1 glycosyltransferase [Thalassomonas actiniarum]
MKTSKPSVSAQVVQHLSPGGIETLVLDLMRHSKHKTLVFSLEGTREQAMEKWPVLKPFADRLVFLNKQPGFQPRVIKALIRLFSWHKITSVHTHHIGPLLYGGLASRFCGIKSLIHTEHDAWHLADKKRRFLQKCLISCLKPSWVADAQAVAEKVSDYLKTSKVKVITNGIDIDKFVPGDRLKARRQFNLPANVSLIGCAARLEPVKGQDILIKALGCLPPCYHLAIAGDGSTKNALKHQVRQAGLGARVHFLGVVDDMPSFYQALDVFCLPSRFEGMPLSPLEAQACNIPSVITNVGGSSEVVCQQSSVLVPPEKPFCIAEAILNLSVVSYRQNPRAFVQQQGNIKDTVLAYDRLASESG